MDGHALILQLSHNAKRAGGADSRSSATKAKADKKESSTKIIVRNVAFEATRKDLLQIFNPFGQVGFDHHLHTVVCNMLASIFHCSSKALSWYKLFLSCLSINY